MMTGRALTRAGIAFAIIFGFYAIGSWTISKLPVPEVLPFQEIRASSIPELNRVTFPLLLQFYSSAMFSAVICAVILAWTITALRRYLVSTSFWLAIATMGVFVMAAMVMTFGTSTAMVSVPRSLSCVSNKDTMGFLCGYPLKTTAFDHDWVSGLLFVKLALNLLFEAMAIVIIAALLAIVSVSSDANRPDQWQRLADDKAATMLMIAGGTVLSLITVTDVVFANWPLSVTPKSKGLEGVMSALTFYYALLGSLTLGSAIIVSHWFSRGRLVQISGDNGKTVVGWLPKLRQFSSVDRRCKHSRRCLRS